MQPQAVFGGECIRRSEPDASGSGVKQFPGTGHHLFGSAGHRENCRGPDQEWTRRREPVSSGRAVRRLRGTILRRL